MLETSYFKKEQVREWQREGYLQLQSSKYGLIKIPYVFAEDALKYDVLEEMKKISSPLLVIVGADDVTVPPENTKLIFNAANKPKKLIKIEGMNHFYKKQEGMNERVNKEVVKFFSKNL